MKVDIWERGRLWVVTKAELEQPESLTSVLSPQQAAQVLSVLSLDPGVVDRVASAV